MDVDRARARDLPRSLRPAIVTTYRMPNMPSEPQYIVIDQKSFIKEDLVLDNHVYRNCQLEHCRLYYSGGPFELIDTHITNSELVLNQPAKNIYAAVQIFRTKSPSSTIVFE
jgi:hypothetical protein